MLLDLLDDFKEKKGKEMIKLHYNYLYEIVVLVVKNINEPYEYLNNLIKTKLKIASYNLQPVVPKPVNFDSLPLDDLRSQILNLLDKYITENKLTITRKELIDQLNLDQRNKITLWNDVKSILNWINSKTPIVYNNRQLMITY